MNPPPPSALAPLLDLLIEGEADDSARLSLLDLLQANPALVRETALHLSLAEALRRLQPPQDPEEYVSLISRLALRSHPDCLDW